MNVLSCDSLFRRALAATLLCTFAANTLANPTGMTVASGSATAATSGSQLTVTTSRSAFLNWQSFNIAAGETTIFNQPSVNSVVVNRINDQNPSQIFGSLQANGMVVLLNSSGFYFGPNSFVQTAGLVVSTANCLPPQNTGGTWEFNGPPPLASIVNYGQIKVGNGGSAFLIADKIENHGDIEAPNGSVGLASGQTVLLSERPDGRGMSMAVTLPGGSVDNEGKLIADGGTIAMHAQVVNQNGFIQANSVQNQNGIIELVASGQLNLGANSVIQASGDNSSSGSAGGNVTLKSGNDFSDSVGSQIDVSGGAQGGNGGNVEISAPNILALKSAINAGAQSGWKSGIFTLDPLDIVLGTVEDTGVSGVLYVDVNNEFQNINADIELKASGNIYVGDGVVNSDGTFTSIGGVIWDLYTSTGYKTEGLLTLLAGGNITFVDGSLITYSADPTLINSWAVTLKAGYNFANNTVQSGVGNIYLNGGDGLSGSGSIETSGGAIDLTAGQDIQVGSGFVRTTGGGAVSAWALNGDVNTGTYDHAYTYNPSSSGDPYYEIDASFGVGGISTSGGGNVRITAGGNVTGYLPSTTDSSDAGTGTFADQGSGVTGDVTIIAGGNVTGHYAVANGTGTIIAGGSAGTADSKLALSLITGGWTVDAANNIFLQEVRNPNGIFNDKGNTAIGNPSYHYFDYAADAYVNLVAGNSVTLGTGLGGNASNPPRNDDLPFIYAPILNIVAGAGGVELTGTSSQLNKLGELILFPSPLGSLTITTTGDLTGQYQARDGSLGLYDLIVSDSGYRQYYSLGLSADVFGAGDHAATPIHSTSPTPITLNIIGNMDSVLLSAPEAAQITVGGDMINSRFQGMNLSSDPNLSVQVPVRGIDGSQGTATVHPGLTSINVTGDIVNRGEFTSIGLPSGAQIPDLSLLSELYVDNNNPLPTGLTGLTAATLVASLFYDKNTKQLTYQNILLNGNSLDVGTLMDFLEGKPYTVNGKDYTMTIQDYKNGVPQYDLEGNPILVHNVSVLDSATGSGLANTYNALGVVPVGNGSGYILGGGGQFNITAHNIDLGTSGGIQSQGVAYDTYYPLDKRFRPIYDANGNKVEVYPLTKLSDFAGGANISVTVSGNLDMFSTIISTVNGGNININAVGGIIAGSDEFSGQGNAPRGIFTTAGGDVTVVANGDIAVNGSRIATYDGGNVTVESLDGNVNAGHGAASSVTVDGYYMDPYVDASTLRNVYHYAPQLPFSGIVALTFPQRNSSYPAPLARLGNILVEAPRGDIIANVAGILQIPLNNAGYPNAITTVLAGYELQDGLGNPVTAGDLAAGTPVLVSGNRDINASGSGVLASNAKLEASGNIIGLIFALNNVDINAQQNINVVVLGGQSVNVNSSGGTISGTLIGGTGVNVGGIGVDAALISANVSGATSGQSGLGQGNAANATAQAVASDDSAKTVVAANQTDDDDKKKQKGPGGVLMQKTGRVTVLLPPKNLSQNQTSNNHL